MNSNQKWCIIFFVILLTPVLLMIIGNDEYASHQPHTNNRVVNLVFIEWDVYFPLYVLLSITLGVWFVVLIWVLFLLRISESKAVSR